ncbi:hypothetical protein [Skermanella stibiiresistens]|uniref:hypothetical protein n=1 Tax=Skermanella stibiiresistens TaxID=913326 RepID=UPI0012FA78CD|nr:hypothetical protein [Skermanella stibiiresistens]
MTKPDTTTGDLTSLKASDGTVVGPIKPSKTRLTIVMIGFVYPIVTLLLYALNPLAENWAVWHRTLVLAPVTVSLIVFVVSPVIAKHFDWFLRPRSARRRVINASLRQGRWYTNGISFNRAKGETRSSSRLVEDDNNSHGEQIEKWS